MLRDHEGPEQVTNIELFFDLVYVFAVTQLSHQLVAHRTVTVALQTALLWALIWLVWVYTSWVTNWLDPGRLPVRSLLFVLSALSLVMSAALPQAFGNRGQVVGVTYAAMQIGRSAFAVRALRGERLRRNYERILCWCVVSGALAVAGGLVHGSARYGLWLGAVAVDLLGGMAGFYTPGLGRSTTSEWSIEGSHLAERCQAFVLIALGESVVAIGATVSNRPSVSTSEILAFVVAFAGSLGLWWIYFDRSAEAGADVIATSKDPGRLGRSAYNFIHPVMVGGIIVCAAGDQEVMAEPLRRATDPVIAAVLGGTALFLAGHAMFKATVWEVRPWSRLVAVVVLALFVPVALHLPAIGVGAGAAAVLIAVAASDRLVRRVWPVHEPPRLAVVDEDDEPAGTEAELRVEAAD